MQQKLPPENTGKWVFDLQQDQTLQFRIASEQGTDAPVLIEGHDISVLLDYLYSHRELIYEATHDQERRRLEAIEARQVRLRRPRVEPVLYFDDGVQRVRADL